MQFAASISCTQRHLITVPSFINPVFEVNTLQMPAIVEKSWQVSVLRFTCLFYYALLVVVVLNVFFNCGSVSEVCDPTVGGSLCIPHYK